MQQAVIISQLKHCKLLSAFHTQIKNIIFSVATRMRDITIKALLQATHSDHFDANVFRRTFKHEIGSKEMVQRNKEKSWSKLTFRSALCTNRSHRLQDSQSTKVQMLEMLFRNRSAFHCKKQTLCSVQHTICLYAIWDRTIRWPVHASTMFTIKCHRTLWRIKTKMCTRLVTALVHQFHSSALFEHFPKRPIRHWKASTWSSITYVMCFSAAL